MIASWVHIGRLWTNGEPFLAMDADLRPAWRGSSDDQFEQVVELGDEDTGIPVGDGRAVLVGADGVVRDDSWIEVFNDDHDRIALVQASGPDYRRALAGALTFSHADDQEGEVLAVESGTLAIFSAAIDGTGEYSGPFVTARPGPPPVVHGPPSADVNPGLLLQTRSRAFRLKVRWYTVLDNDSCFARWLLTPLRPDDV